MVKINYLKKQKKGWIHLVEVFLSILLLAGVLLVTATQISSNSNKNNLQTQISEKEIAILRDIELNNNMRTEIVNVNSDSLPLEWNDFGDELQDVMNRIIELTPTNFDCKAKLCLLDQECVLNEEIDGDVYAKSVMISADLDVYSPRELKLFCMNNA